MIKQIKGLHHVTSLASDASKNNAFFTNTLGLRRVKKTVNFDNPEVYHLYYGDEKGSPGSVMTYFPFPNIGQGRMGTGEVGTTAFSVPVGSIGFWQERFAEHMVDQDEIIIRFGEKRLPFRGPDGDSFELVECEDDDRQQWISDETNDQVAIHGFHSASMRVNDPAASIELLKFMNYQTIEQEENFTRMMVQDGNRANIIELESAPSSSSAIAGKGSVHHIAFSVENREAQLEVRSSLMDTGYAVTPVIDRDYFWAIYFRTPDGILFEVATNEPGFDRDEDTQFLGEALKLPTQHSHLRERLEQSLPPL